MVIPEEKVSFKILFPSEDLALHEDLSSALPQGLGEVQATFSTNATATLQSCAAALMDKVDWIKVAIVA